MKDILMLIDDRGMFYSSTKGVAVSMDVPRVKIGLERLGYSVDVKKFYEIDFDNSYKDKVVLYQSTEDPDLKYKDYIEDVLLGLQNSGATLVPDFDKFRMHHNKVFMEISRSVWGLNKKSNIYSREYGTVEDFIEDIENHVFPIVIKPGAGSRSKDVYKADNVKDARRKARKVSRTFTVTNIKRFLTNLLTHKGYRPISNFRNKFVVQNYIEGLSGDFRVLVYGDKYYVLERQNRKNDFRASGSGLISFPQEIPEKVLNYSKELFETFDTPFVSLDIAMNGDSLYLLEFQFVGLGQYALEKSDCYFTNSGNEWKKVAEKSDLEEVFVESIHKYISLYVNVK